MTVIQPSSGHDSPADRIDSLCDSFESQWCAGQQPRIEDLLRLVPEAERAVLLRELLVVEIECRQQSGPALGLDEALLRFPQDLALVRALFDKPTSEVESAFNLEQTSLPAGQSPPAGEVDTDPLATVTGTVEWNSGFDAGAAISAPGASRPQRFGDYELLHEIARGGMGVVFKARQIKLNRIVALKMILAGAVASPEAIERFRTEAQAAANLDHQGIVPIFEVGEINGRHFFSMGFVEGPSLAARIREQPLTTRATVEIVIEIAEAIDYAHQNGIIHRDLKPQNILLTLEGRPKITDFGLAKRLENDSNLTSSGQILGTPNYMAPEQAAGKIDEIGPLTDVYALGGILYCMLVGEPPFQGKNLAETLYQVQFQELTSPSRLNPKVHRDLSTICVKALAKSPAGRYSSAAAFADDLRRFFNGDPILARREGWVSYLVRRARRNLVAHLSLLAAAVIVFVAGWLIWQSSDAYQLAALNQQFEAELDANVIDAQSLAKLDGLAESIARVAPESESLARTRIAEKLVASIQRQIARPRLSPPEIVDITHQIDSVGQRSAELAIPLRAALQRRLRNWDTVFELKPPFDNISKFFPTLRTTPDGKELTHGTLPTPLALSSVPSGGIVALESEFLPGVGRGQIGLVIAGRPEDNGYFFLLQFSGDGSGQATLELRRDKIALRRQDVLLPSGAFRLSARREGQLISCQLNDLPRVEFRDPFPLPADDSGRFGILMGSLDRLVQLHARRQNQAPNPSPLESADELYALGKYASALEIYAREANSNADPVTVQESNYKRALCLIAVGRAAEGDELLSSLAGQTGDLWPPNAGCQLWLRRLREKNSTQAEEILESLTSRFRFEELAGMIPEDIREEIVQKYDAMSVGANLFAPNANRVQQAERAVAVRKLLFQFGGEWQLLRAYHGAGRIEEALHYAESITPQFRQQHLQISKASAANASGCLQEHLWLLRIQGRAAEALAILDATPANRNFPLDLERALSIPERVRLLDALGRTSEAEQDAEQARVTLSKYAQRIDLPGVEAIAKPAHRLLGLMLGILRDRRGDTSGAEQIWRSEIEPGWEAAALNANLVYDHISASLAGVMTTEQSETLLTRIFSSVGDSAKVFEVSGIGKTMAPAFAEMFRTVRGKQAAYDIVFRTVPLPSTLRSYPQLAVYDVVRRSLLTDNSPAAHDAILWDACCRAIDLYSEGKLRGNQVVPLVLTWKGTNNFLGWGALSPTIAPEFRGPLAFMMGLRYEKLGRPKDAIEFFRQAEQDGGTDSSLSRESQQERLRLEKQ